METIRSAESLERLILRIVYHDAQLGADTRFPEMLNAVDEIYHRARALESQRQTETVTRVRTLASRNRADIKVTEAGRDFELAVLSLVHRSNEDERYILFFGKMTLARILKLPISEKLDHLQRIIISLDNPSVASLRDPHKNALQAAVDLLKIAQSQYEEALRALVASGYLVMAFREELMVLFRTHYGELIKAFPRNKREVEQFFIHLNTEKKGNKNSQEKTS